MSSLSTPYNHSHPDILPSKVPQLSHPDILESDSSVEPATPVTDAVLPSAEVEPVVVDSSAAVESMPVAEDTAGPAEQEEQVVQENAAYQTDLSAIDLPSSPFRIFDPGVEVESAPAAEEVVEPETAEIVEELPPEPARPEVSLASPSLPVEKKAEAPSRPKAPRKPRNVLESRRPRSVMEAIEFYGHDEDFRPIKSGEDKSFVPTNAAPGSAEKLEILAERARRGFDLWHDDDRNNYSGTTPGGVRPRD